MSLDDPDTQAHLLANRGFIPLEPLEASPHFTVPFLEYFCGSWLQLLSAPYFLLIKGESPLFWWRARFRSTYQPGFAFVALIVVVSLSLVWGLNPTEGYVLLVLHTYSSAVVALHYGFLSDKQRKRFLSFSGVKQLRARKGHVQDPMATAESLSGRPLSGPLTILNASLLRLLVDQCASGAAAARNRYFVSGAEGSLQVKPSGAESLVKIAHIKLSSFADRLLTEYAAMRRKIDLACARDERECEETGTSASQTVEVAKSSGGTGVAELDDSAANQGEESTLVLEEAADTPDAKTAGPAGSKVAPGALTITEGALQPDESVMARRQLVARSPGQATASRRVSSAGNTHLRKAWGKLGSFRPYKWTVPTRLLGREIAARASSGASISLFNLRIARLLAVLAVLTPAIQFAYSYPCIFLISFGSCDPGAFFAVQPNIVGRIIVFVVAASGAYFSAFVILRLMLRIKARSTKRLTMLRALRDCTDFSASLRTRLPYVDLRLPGNACNWTSLLDTLVGFYEEKDNVNSYEILSTIMAWNALVALAALVVIVLLALAVVRVQLQTFVAFSVWGVLLSSGLALALLEEATTNEVLEELSRRLQHTRTLIAEEITALCDITPTSDAAMSGTETASSTARATNNTSTSGDNGDGEHDPLAISLSHRRAAIERRLGDSPRHDPAPKALRRGMSKGDILEQRCLTMRSVASSAEALAPEERRKLASKLQGSMRVLESKIGELASGAARSRLFGVVISFPLLRGVVAAILTTILSLVSVVFSNMGG